jgi:hypothetical protein
LEFGIWSLEFEQHCQHKISGWEGWFTPEVAIAKADLKLVANHPFAAIASTG